jgi:hypothetical protein
MMIVFGIENKVHSTRVSVVINRGSLISVVSLRRLSDSMNETLDTIEEWNEETKTTRKAIIRSETL